MIKNKMEEKKYPYLGKRTYKDDEYVVMFTDDNYGVVVMSNVTSVSELKFGQMGEFDESSFEYLTPEQCVRLSN